MVLLPHQQTVLNVFQPEYVHMFETLLASPKPWYYLHVLLPGVGRDGVENLCNPEYALPGLGDDDDAPGPKATLQGTLMQVIGVQRLSTT